MPKTFMRMKAKKMEKGMDRATTTLGLTPPMKTSSTKATSTTPWIRASVTVLTHLPTRVA